MELISGLSIINMLDAGGRSAVRGKSEERGSASVLGPAWALCRAVLRRLRRSPVPSQSNEQALIAKHLRDADVNRTFCEFGFDAHEFNCGGLMSAGWRGLLIDGDARKVAAAQSFVPGTITVRCEYLVRETIFDAIAHYFPSGELGVLSIDVDGNDYWFMETLLPLRPGLLVCEYNASLLHFPITVPYEAAFDRHAKHPRGFYHGASLSALTLLGARHGYDLVAVSDGGLNAFFRRRGPGSTGAPLDPVAAYRPNVLRAQYNDGMTPEQQWESIRHLPFLVVG